MGWNSGCQAGVASLDSLSPLVCPECALCRSLFLCLFSGPPVILQSPWELKVPGFLPSAMAHFLNRASECSVGRNQFHYIWVL